MKTKAVRIYGQGDLRLETFELPPITEDEVLVKVISDSLCMSSYKAAMQGAKHKRVPDDVAENPTIIGHEFCGEIIEVGKTWQEDFKVGEKFAIQPAYAYEGKLDAPGYSFQYSGGDATYCIVPREALVSGALLKYDADCYYYGSLAEPMSCIVGAFHASYHTTHGVYAHEMGIVEGGKMAILAGVGPMGLGAIDYALHCDRRPSMLVVTDIDDARLARARSIFTEDVAKEAGVDLYFYNTRNPEAEAEIMALTDGKGFDDVLVMAPVKPVVEQGDRLLGRDGCLNFFAGPTDASFSALMNFYNVHYGSTHIVGTSGGNTDDMRESLAMMSAGRVNPTSMITHVGGLNTVVETTLTLPKIPGGKKLIYTHIDMPLTAIDDFDKLGERDPFYKALADITKKYNNLWSPEAESFLLENGKKLD